MTQTTITPATDRPGPLSLPASVILGLHVVAAVAFAVIGFVSTSDLDGFADLGRIIVAMISVGWVVSAGVSWLIARFAVRSNPLRLAIALFGPLAAWVAIIGITRFG